MFAGAAGILGKVKVNKMKGILMPKYDTQKLKINRGQAIEQVILTLGTYPEVVNLAAMAERIVNDLYNQSVK